MMNAGLSSTLMTWFSASWDVPVPLVLTGLLNPKWLSLTCAKVKPASAALAWPITWDRGIPPATVQSIALPAQVIHFRTPRRFGSRNSVVIVTLLHGPAQAPGLRA